MYKHILIATDGSELAGKALRHALDLAGPLGAEVTILTVSEALPPLDATSWWGCSNQVITDYRKVVHDVFEGILAEAAAEARSRGIEPRTLHVEDRSPAEAILDVSARFDIDLVVMATHGRRGLGRVLIGSQANEVVSRSKIPVLLVR